MKTIIPEAALAQHTAILGKTGSGKTSTAKLAIEQVVAAGARVCILDTVKSDWWGLTSSADGKKPGLPFHILGGPRGHVGLHSSAGKAIGELVASGALRHSIIDMADFEAGGAQRFFVDFAPALLRNMRGVLYLVIEEAHELAPKERAGFGAENMSIHFAKKLATAGRSKGIRLVVLSQRTQSLHNAVLGSCDTMIAHRFTAPADQEPIIKWLKSNLAPERAREVAASFSGLKTGEGWICGGESQLFERRQFPRIHTYDNSATPADDDHQHAVKTAPVDAEALKTIIGVAVKEAEENDPKRLRAKITTQEAELARLRKSASPPAVVVDQVAVAAARQEGREEGAREGYLTGLKALEPIAERVGTLAIGIAETIEGYQADLKRLAKMPPPIQRQAPARPSLPVSSPVRAPEKRTPTDSAADIGGGAKRRVMIALAQNPDGLSARKLSILSDVKRGGSTWRAAMAALRRDQHSVDNGEHFKLTAEGLAALGDYEPLPTGDALRQHWRSKMGNATRLAVFDAILDAYPRAISAQDVATTASVELGGSTWRAHMAHLRGLELITGGRGDIKASEDLFG